MILSDLQILSEIEKGNIKIDPFNRECLGSNSYDLHLSKHLACYKKPIDGSRLILDCKKHNEIEHFEIPEEGYTLYPGENLYLGTTIEFTHTNNHVPCIEGKSSIARLGLFVHITAGFGDIGFSNTWVLEIICVLPVKIYAGMPIAQIYYHTTGQTNNPYNKKLSAKYNTKNIKPTESMMFKNEF